MRNSYGLALRTHPTWRNKLRSFGRVACAALVLLPSACDTEDAFTESNRQQAERNCTQEQERNMVSGESHGECVKRWMTLLGD